ncbi:MAG: hypothetical protein J2P36_14605 [Ktedonobacteraceae bacterium]|nr:hypothetical protein [Ktedonobacteraceae bacterium]
MIDRSGQQVDTPRLLRLPGYGTFDVVYQGEPLYRKTQVAIKVLRLSALPFQKWEYNHENNSLLW